MKAFGIWTCVLTVLLWSGAQALAQGKGQGKGQGKDEQPRVKENAPESGKAPTDKPEDKGGKGKQAAEKPSAKSKPEATQGKKAGKTDDGSEKGKGKGKGQQQQLQAFDKQLRHEQAKHMERQARLTRIRELAVQKGDAEAIARVDKLIAKEQQVYGRKQLHLQGQKRAVQEPATTTPAAPETKVESPVPAPTAPAAPDAKAGSAAPASDANAPK